MMHLRLRLVPLVIVAVLLNSGTPFVRAAEAPALEAGLSVAFEAGSLGRARRLIQELREELAPVEDEIRNHPYLEALEAGEVSLDNLQAFAGEQYNIIRSDLRSDALLVSRFGATLTGEFFRVIFEGEGLALPLLLDFAAALGLDEEDLKAYEPRPGAQIFPAQVVALASYGNQADVAAAFLLNFAVFGENTGRMAAALRSQYGFTAAQTAFFDFFAEPIPGFEEDALAVIAEGLDQGAEPRLIKRAARLLQAYELEFWNTVAEDYSGAGDAVPRKLAGPVGGDRCRGSIRTSPDGRLLPIWPRLSARTCAARSARVVEVAAVFWSGLAMLPKELFSLSTKVSPRGCYRAVVI